MEIDYPRLVTPGDPITDPQEIEDFCKKVETPNPNAIHTLYASNLPASSFELVNGVVAVYEQEEKPGKISRLNIYRTPDVEVTLGINEVLTSKYYYIVRLRNSKSILIQLHTSSELKTVLRSLKLTTIPQQTRKQLEQRKKYLVGGHQLFLAEYFKNRRD
ncbi:hypothetical protein KBD71_05575 [Candidatus Woesebacteria bacterium]|nr:hypothetical protein [Candidatus Woesebacteria bacterium]